MLSVTPDPRYNDKDQSWLSYAGLDEPNVHSRNAIICALASCRELHDALRLISTEVRALLSARFVAVVVFEDQHQALAGDVGDVAALTVPLSIGGTSIGQINIYFDRPRPLTPLEAQTLKVIAAVAAVTLDNATMLRRERKRLAQAEAINSIAPTLAAAKDLDEVARRVVSALRDLLHYDAARLLWCGDDGQLHCLAQSTASGGDGTQVWQDGGLAARAMREDTALVASDEQHGVDVPSGRCSLRSLLASPMRGSRGLLGVIEVGARRPHGFDNADLITLSSLASQIGATGERLMAQSRQPSGPPNGAHDLLSIIAHDLRGPLSLVKGYAATLSRFGDSVDGEKRQRFLSGIAEAADRLTIMIDHLVGVSRIESGQFRPNLCHVDLSQLVSETVDRLRPKLGGRPISLELPGKALPVRVDRDHLDHAVSELLLTAARQSPGSTRMTVRIGHDDSGPGVDARGLSRGVAPDRKGDLDVFRDVQGFGVVEVRDESNVQSEIEVAAGRQVSRLDAGGRGANGLELYVAGKIIEAHGGRVWAENELTRGNMFGFCLPLSAAASGHGVLNVLNDQEH